jgi:hypothetical protein
MVATKSAAAAAGDDRNGKKASSVRGNLGGAQCRLDYASPSEAPENLKTDQIRS